MKTQSKAVELLEASQAAWHGEEDSVKYEHAGLIEEIDEYLLDGGSGGGRSTNIEAVVDMMEYSAYGAMAQLVIMTAIEKYCQLAAVERLEEGGMINPDAWQGAAKEILSKLAIHYGRCE